LKLQGGGALDRSVSSTELKRLPRTASHFEGTSEIQRLVVARAISGLHIP